MPKIEEILTGGAGGGVGAKKDASEYRESYAVKALTDMANLKLLAKLPVFGKDHKNGVTFEMDELMSLGYTGVTTGAPHQMFNRVLNRLQMPFVAGSVNRGGVKKVKIVRYGEDYDYTKYSTTEAGKPAKDKEGNLTGGIVDHEDAPPGLVECLESWLEEIAEDDRFTPVLIASIGLDRKMTEMGLLETEETEEEVEEKEE